MAITYTSDKDFLSGYDLSTLKTELKNFIDFLLKSSKDVIGTHSSFNMELIKVLAGDTEKRFQLKIIFTKASEDTGLGIDLYLRDANYVKLIILKDSYTDSSTYESDMLSMVSNISKISE